MVLRKGHCKLRASACHPSRSVGLVPAFGRYRGADLILPISGFAAGPRNLACGHRVKVTGDVACMLSSLFATFRRRGQPLYKGTKIIGTVFTIGRLFGDVYSSASKFFHNFVSGNGAGFRRGLADEKGPDNSDPVRASWI